MFMRASSRTTLNSYGKTMKIFVIGSKGQLGDELLIQGNNLGYEILPADLPDLDITDKAQIKHRLEKFMPSFVVNAAAYTNVDKAETEQNLAFAVNRDGPANLAEICAEFGIPLIHISTEFIFDGKLHCLPHGAFLHLTVAYDTIDPVILILEFRAKGNAYSLRQAMSE